MRYDCVVVGGGISGLTSAAILARQGQRVAVIEKSRKLGPLLRGFKRKGIYFDTGFHYSGSLGRGELLDTYFRYLNLLHRLEIKPFDKEGFDSFQFSDPKRVIDLPYGYDRIQSRLKTLFPREKTAISEYLSAVHEEYHASPHLNLSLDPETNHMTRELSDVSLKDFLNRLTGDPVLKAVLSMHSLLYGSPPSKTSFAHHARVVGSYYQSVHGIAGGGKALVDAYGELLGEHGVDIMCGREATHFFPSARGEIDSVQLKDGQKIFCRTCISTVHPHILLTMLPDGIFRPAYIKRLERLKESFSGYMLYGALSEPSMELSERNYFLCPDTDIESFFSSRIPQEKVPLYVTCGGFTKDHGCRGVIVICPGSFSQTAKWKNSRTSRRPEEYSKYKAEITRRIIQELDAKMPMLKGRITPLETATPLTFRDYGNTPYGSLYGVTHTLGQFNPLPATKLKGLFLAGQALCGPGIMGAMVSAFWAAEHILGQNHMRSELNKCRATA